MDNIYYTVYNTTLSSFLLFDIVQFDEKEVSIK